MNNTLSLQLQLPDGTTHDVTLIGKRDDVKSYGIDSSIVYSVWFADDSPGGYFSFSTEQQVWEYYGYLTGDEQLQISEFLEDYREIKWVQCCCLDNVAIPLVHTGCFRLTLNPIG